MAPCQTAQVGRSLIKGRRRAAGEHVRGIYPVPIEQLKRQVELPACRMPWRPPEELRTRFRELHVSLDAMTTGPAVRTYNVMLMEGRRIGAGLIAIE